MLAIALLEERILLTNDRDFGELVFRQQLRHSGIILFRLEQEPAAVKAQWLEYLLNNHPGDVREFIVVTEKGVRIRHRK